MGRLITATDTTASQTLVAGASYGPANELTSITGASGGWYGETLTYNSIKQLTSLASSGVSIAYNYPTSNNNGKVGSQTDSVSGETVSYTYDSLNRLITAQNQTGFTPLWGQSYAYDGFGNLTGTSVTQGSAPTLSATYDVNNHAGGEDANGNPPNVYLPADGSSYATTYDVENRLTSTGAGAIFYSYAPGNRRVWRGTGTWTTHSGPGTGQCNTGQWSTDEITFWGVNGQKLMTYNLVESYYGGGGGGECDFTATAGGTNYYFGGKLIKNPSGYVYPDRLGSVGKFYPYGIERPSATTNGKEKFTGYFRDADTGNDYAINRYMTPGMGRFITPDPSKGSHADPANPGSWNLYAYTHGDPINSSDPTGLCPLESGGDGDDSSCGDSGVTAQECEMYNIDPDPNFCEAIISAGIGESSGGGGDGSASSAPSPTDPVPGPQCDVTISPNGTYQCTATGSPTTNSIVDDPHGSQVSSQPGSASSTAASGGSQTFSQCMAANANNYSIAGVIDRVAGTNIRNSTLGGAVLGNSITTLAYGSLGDNAVGTILETPTFVSRGMGAVTSYGRRTATVMSLNIAGRGGLPLALGAGTTALKGAISFFGEVVSVGLEFETKLAIDAAFAAAEAVSCRSHN